MSEPVPCPKCQALLRLPPGAATVRCPGCQTVLAVEPADAAPPTPPPAAPTAPPLPLFGRPTQPARPAAPPARPAPPPRSVPAKRAKLVADEPESIGEDADEDARRRQIRRELRKIEEQEAAEREWLEELARHCQKGRLALNLLTWGVRGYALAVMFQLVSLAAAGLTLFAISGLAGLVSLAFAGITSLLFAVGFGFAIAGPFQGRHLGIMGLVVTIAHAIGGILQPANLAIVAGIEGLEGSSTKTLWSQLLVVQDFLGLATDLPLLADHPARFLHGYIWSLPGLIVAALEFTRLVLICMLTQNYAVAGKDPETGHRSFNTVSRVFFAVLLTASFRLAVSSIFDSAPVDDLWFVVGHIIHGSVMFGCYFAIGLALFLQSRTMTDVIDLVDYRRLADKRERLDQV